MDKENEELLEKIVTRLSIVLPSLEVLDINLDGPGEKAPQDASFSV